MNCKLNAVAKHFNDHIIFSGINLEIESTKNYVILGGNGSGKSTLLKTIAGGVSVSEGSIEYSIHATSIAYKDLHNNIAFCSPYMELIEEFSFAELIAFQGKFKPFQKGLSSAEILELSGLNRISNKPIRNFSSGMKQRVKLCLAIFSDARLLLLDEPTSNLDPKGKAWYKELLNKYTQNKTVIVASNFLEEEFPEHPIFIELSNYKG
jgi:ABC-type multidrug transport system ATPase subunit